MDNAATTRVTEPVFEAMRPYFCEIFGDPSSVHAFGREARKAVEQARRQVAAALGAQAGEIYFTGSGTEARQLGAARRGLRAKGARPSHHHHAN